MTPQEGLSKRVGGEFLYWGEISNLAILPRWTRRPKLGPMKELMILLVHLLSTVARLVGPGGAKGLVAENLLIKRQFLTRSRQRAPNLRPCTLPRGDR